MTPHLRRVLALVAPHRWRLGLGVLAGFATVASSMALMSTSAYLISVAALRPSIADLRVAIAGVRFFGIARGLFRYLERIVSHEVTFRLLTRVRVWFYRTLEPLAPARLLEYRSGDLLGRIVSDMETLENIYLQVIGPTLVAAAIAVATCALLSALSVKLASVVVLVLGVAGVGGSILARSLGRNPGGRLVSLRSDLEATLVDSVQGSADLLAFDHGFHHQKRIEQLSREYEAANGRTARLRGLGGAVTVLATDVAVVAALVVTIPLVSRGELNGVYLAVVALATMAVFEAVTPLPPAYQKLEESLSAARRLFEILDAGPPVPEPEAPSPLPDRFSIRVQDLCFSYPSDASRPALDRISFEVAEGSFVAIVGPSGAGKSTLAHLLLRFWDYSEGSILLGGEDLRRLPPDDVRRCLGVVSQSPHLFSGTVRGNLLMARPSATEDELHRAARRASIHDFIQSLPDGYDTWIGEQGLRLRGGERQRLAIARALLKDAPIIILDEPTANLDPLTERAILREIRTALSGHTTLLITHRLVGLHGADEILVLHQGRIIERGTESQLLQKDGMYRAMYRIQRGERAIENLSAAAAHRLGKAW